MRAGLSRSVFKKCLAPYKKLPNNRMSIFCMSCGGEKMSKKNVVYFEQGPDMSDKHHSDVDSDNVHQNNICSSVAKRSQRHHGSVP
jgi:hypothetical protein